VSVRAHGSEVDTENASARVGASYFRGSGTSFATAAMAGAAATLLQHRPELSPEQVKSLVRSTAYQGRSLTDRHSGGAGGLDLQAALAAETPAVEAPVFDAPPPGDDRAWRAFLQGLMDDDRAAAHAAWKQISPEGHRWGGHRWGGHRWGGHRWGANGWSGHRWASSDVSADEWEMRVWAGHRWAGHRWGSDAFVGHRWGADSWSGHRWGADSWSGHRWGADSWSGHRWGASSWVASRWA
jgi:serine protease AprX